MGEFKNVPDGKRHLLSTEILEDVDDYLVNENKSPSYGDVIEREPLEEKPSRKKAK